MQKNGLMISGLILKMPTDMNQFVNMESDIPFDQNNYNAGELPDTLDEFCLMPSRVQLSDPTLQTMPIRFHVWQPSIICPIL